LRETPQPERCLSQAQVFAARAEVLNLHLAPALEEYIVQFTLATRTPKAYGDDLARWVAYGASPRGTIALDRCARAHAWLNGRDFVAPEDVHAVAADVLRHRVLLSYEAEAEQSADKLTASRSSACRCSVGGAENCGLRAEEGHPAALFHIIHSRELPRKSQTLSPQPSALAPKTSAPTPRHHAPALKPQPSALSNSRHRHAG
jgi:MoxR-like ATPase